MTLADGICRYIIFKTRKITCNSVHKDTVLLIFLKMLNSCCQHLKYQSSRLMRNGQSVRHAIGGKGAYEGEGKTTVTILNRDADYGIMIDKLTLGGFKLNLGLNILGPMIIFPRTVISWTISTATDINENSLALFKVLEPRPDILILGLDTDYPRDTPFIKSFKEITKRLGINNEVLTVDKACTTFNFLNAEKRYVVAALLPPRNLDDCDFGSLQDMALKRILNQDWRQPEKPTITQLKGPLPENLLPEPLPEETSQDTNKTKSPTK